MDNEVVYFINRRFDSDCNWLNGNCYWFAKILIDRFPNLAIYYLPTPGHFVAGDGKRFYDWSGELDLPLAEALYKFDDILEFDPLWYKHLVRDCVN